MGKRFWLCLFLSVSVASADPYPLYPMIAPYLIDDPNASEYLSPEEAKAFKLEVTSRNRVKIGGQTIQSGGIIFVMDEDGNFYGSLDPRGHSTFFRGRPVAAAGHIHIEDGKIVSIMNSSGHYQPPGECLFSVGLALLKLGVKVNEIRFLDIQQRVKYQSFHIELARRAEKTTPDFTLDASEQARCAASIRWLFKH